MTSTSWICRFVNKRRACLWIEPLSQDPSCPGGTQTGRRSASGLSGVPGRVELLCLANRTRVAIASMGAPAVCAAVTTATALVHGRLVQMFTPPPPPPPPIFCRLAPRPSPFRLEQTGLPHIATRAEGTPDALRAWAGRRPTDFPCLPFPIRPTITLDDREVYAGAYSTLRVRRSQARDFNPDGGCAIRSDPINTRRRKIH